MKGSTWVRRDEIGVAVAGVMRSGMGDKESKGPLFAGIQHRHKENTKKGRLGAKASEGLRVVVGGTHSQHSRIGQSGPGRDFDKHLQSREWPLSPGWKNLEAHGLLQLVW